MADAYTTAASSNFGQIFIVGALDRLAYFSLRPELYFDQVATVQATHQNNPGSSVTFQIVNDLAAATGTLNESNDVSAVAATSSNLTVSLSEYGNAVITTALLRGETFVDIDPVVANVVGYNAGISLDSIARTAIAGGSNVDYGGGRTARGQLQAGDVITTALIQTENARLRSNNVANFGGFYAAFVHPNVSYDLRTSTTAPDWRDPHVYSQPGEIWSGELGAYEGFRFIETPRAPVLATGGSGSTVVYQSLFVGRQALAKAFSDTDGNGAYPHIVPGPITDHLRRFVPWGWYWLGGYGIFRSAAVRRMETESALSYVDPTIDQN